jgi:hypothetical protein
MLFKTFSNFVVTFTCAGAYGRGVIQHSPVEHNRSAIEPRHPELSFEPILSHRFDRDHAASDNLKKYVDHVAILHPQLRRVEQGCRLMSHRAQRSRFWRAHSDGLGSPGEARTFSGVSSSPSFCPAK